MREICITNWPSGFGYEAPAPEAKIFKLTCGQIYPILGTITGANTVRYFVVRRSANAAYFIPTTHAQLIEVVE